jgi:dihydrofolate reductase (trimethoprim resistance protein)
MDQSSNDVSTAVAGQFALPLRATFGLGDRVRKKSGAAWQGQVVGWYCTKLTQAQYKSTLWLRLNAWPDPSIDADPQRQEAASA